MARSKKKGEDQPASPRERIKHYLVQRFYTRFHMSLILISAGLAAMVASWGLLHLGVGRMWIRYPVAVTASYLTFLAGVWLWIQYIEWRKGGAEQDAASANKRSLADGGDALDLVTSGPSGGGGNVGGVEIPNVLRGGGGGFDGGGAAGTWDDVVPVQSLTGNPGGGISVPSGGSSGSGLSDIFDFGDLDGDALILIVLALLLIGSLLFVSGYILWFAPDILTEAIFGAALAGGVARAAKRQDSEGWVMGVVKKTWWPFAIVFALAMAFAVFAQIHYPAAKTFGEAIQLAIAG